MLVVAGSTNLTLISSIPIPLVPLQYSQYARQLNPQQPNGRVWDTGSIGEISSDILHMRHPMLGVGWLANDEKSLEDNILSNEDYTSSDRS